MLLLSLIRRLLAMPLWNRTIIIFIVNQMRFYKDSSVLTQSVPDGMMTYVTTVQAINEKILLLNFPNYKSDVLTVDAEYSYKDGVIVLFTGCLSGKDNVKMKLTESLFLVSPRGWLLCHECYS